MKIVIAPDSFQESLNATQVTTAIESGFKKVFPKATYCRMPLANGGKGTLNALLEIFEGDEWVLTTTSPLGSLNNSRYGLFNRGKMAIIELAESSGLALVPPHKRNPGITTSYGLGELILDALDQGAKHLIIATGDSATNDAGVGMMQALGASFLNKEGKEIPFGGYSLIDLAKIDLTNLDPRLNGITIDVASYVSNPLTGQMGTSYLYSPIKGASPHESDRLEAALLHYNEVVKESFHVDLNQIVGGGAAGGIGSALHHFLGARLRPSIEIILELTQFENEIKEADLIITGENDLNEQSMHKKTILGVTKLAKTYNVPLIIISNTDQDNVANQLLAKGVTAQFSAINDVDPNTQCSTTSIYNNIERLSQNIASLLALSFKKE